MMDKDKLRKADIISGSLICLFGLWIISQALKMPMKDSWGGVQNVWFVSPALLPLFVGAMISLLGALLARTALKTVGQAGFKEVLRWLGSRGLWLNLQTPAVMRFYAMVVLFFSFVFVHISRIDFFIGSVFFLTAFITMFYFDKDVLLRKLLLFYCAETILLLLFLILDLSSLMDPAVPYPADGFVLLLILAYIAYAWRLARDSLRLRRKYRTSLLLAFAAPFTIGPIFKFLLLVPMPTEGLVTVVMDAIRYWDF